MGKIIIKKVIYSGENFSFESPELKAGLNIIEGKNGNGKSTFMNLIYYGLSGKVEEFTQSNKETHRELTQDKNNFVRLDLLIDAIPYSFIRYISSTDITVLSGVTDAKVFPINRSKNEKEIFSDWILSQLGIDTIEVFQGTHNSKINFKDLLRLIYHNQELNPKKVYKPADLENFISDSELIRKIIFELLVGKTFAEYYSTFAKFKEKEKEKTIAKAILDDYVGSLRSHSSEEDLNLVFLQKAKVEKEEQLAKLNIYRESIRDQQRPKNRFYTQINEIKSQILTNELSLNEKNKSYNDVANELGKLRRLRDNVILEVTQISKIIHSHEKLSLFSADTCPYCLREVNRVKGHCVCGSDIEEEQYERFFYSSDEYTDILKSKQKSIETIDVAISSCLEETSSLGKQIEQFENQLEEYKNQLTFWIGEYDFSSNRQELKQADDSILAARSEINSLMQKIEIEEKRDSLQKRYTAINSLYETLRDSVRLLEAKASADIKSKVDEFNTIYNDLIINTLPNCRSATIGYDDYMPIIDGGIYKEASASVAIRIMYFFTLLKLSLDNADVKYPKLLLIDTPETAGVDSENLKQALSQINKITENHKKEEYQIILTTGLGKYPEAFKDSVLLTLSDDEKLLRPIEISS
jgi:ABC-type molybdenum transport system ATPase subunit/photorepair protein PhrA